MYMADHKNLNMDFFNRFTVYRQMPNTKWVYQKSFGVLHFFNSRLKLSKASFKSSSFCVHLLLNPLQNIRLVFKIEAKSGPILSLGFDELVSFVNQVPFKTA